jgi:zinc/manganese transport system substrate-binding protein
VRPILSASKRGAARAGSFAAVVLVGLGLADGPWGAAGMPASASVPAASTGGRPVRVVAAENQYGDVALQVGGRYVSVRSVESNPDTDPHAYEVSPRVAGEVSVAQLVIQNGLGYDSFMQKIESASPSPRRLVVDVQHLLGLGSAPNPHLWYRPSTMPKVADALAGDLSRLDPGHRAYFQANARRFIASLNPWLAAVARLRAAYPGAPVATTEPVADYLLQAAGLHNLTPWSLQADIMNGVDPSPQDISLERDLLSHRKVRVFVYNQQVTDSLTESFVADAQRSGIPIVGVYETMPVAGFHYQSWMMAEVGALQRALAERKSSERL